MIMHLPNLAQRLRRKASRPAESSQWKERGAAVVEFALIVPILITLVIGIAEFAHAYYLQTTVSAAAREGVRSMAVGKDAAAARTATKQASAVTLTDSQIAISTTTCPVDTNATVTVTYPTTFITGLFGTTLTLKGRAVMRCGG